MGYKFVMVLLMFLMTANTASAQDNIEESGWLILDRDRSIVLPNFDTSSIVGSNIEEIVLSLYLLERTPKSSEQVQITINPFDPSTKQAENGLSAFIQPNVGGYVDFRLPIELFEKVLGSDQRFLVKIVEPNQKLIFAGPDIAGTTEDPRLTIVHGEPGATQPLEQLPVIVNNNYINIENSQVHFGPGDNIGRDKFLSAKDAQSSSKQNILNNPWVIGIGVGLIVMLLGYYLWGIGKSDSKNIQQYHSGGGDNVGGDKN